MVKLLLERGKCTIPQLVLKPQSIKCLVVQVGAGEGRVTDACDAALALLLAAPSRYHTLHPPPFTPHPTPHTLHPTLETMNPQPLTLN